MIYFQVVVWLLPQLNKKLDEHALQGPFLPDNPHVPTPTWKFTGPHIKCQGEEECLPPGQEEPWKAGFQAG